MERINCKLNDLKKIEVKSHMVLDFGNFLDSFSDFIDRRSKLKKIFKKYPDFIFLDISEDDNNGIQKNFIIYVLAKDDSLPEYITKFNVLNKEYVTKINLHEKVTSVDFSMCCNLKKIELPDSVIDFGANGFFCCENLESIKLPATYKPKLFPRDFFSACSSLKSVEIPDSVKVIGSNAFYGCASLKQIVIPSQCFEIEGHAFSHCIKLESIVLPEGLEIIGEEAFACCENLKEIRLPNSIKKIGEDDSFYLEHDINIIAPDFINTDKLFTETWIR